MNTAPDGPLIVQSDRTVLLEVAHPLAEDARHDLAVFAELERAPEHIHTYRITRLGLWNARALRRRRDGRRGRGDSRRQFATDSTATHAAGFAGRNAVVCTSAWGSKHAVQCESQWPSLLVIAGSCNQQMKRQIQIHAQQGDTDVRFQEEYPRRGDRRS